MDYVSFFRQFSTLSVSSYALFLDKCKKKSADRGKILLKEGEVQKEMLLVLEGVQMSFYYHNDKQHIIAFSYPPSPSGVPESFFSQQPSRFCLQGIFFSSRRSTERLFLLSFILIRINHNTRPSYR